jgi:hypothetical protein
MDTNFSGLAAAHELDVLLSHDDFEPEHEVDTIALDATIDALAEAARLVEALAALRAALAAGGDAEAIRGLSLDVHLSHDALGMITAELGGYEPKAGVVL